MQTGSVAERQKHGLLVTAVWVAGSAYLFLRSGGPMRLFTIDALLFIAIGLVVAAMVVGALNYGIQHAASAAVARWLAPMAHGNEAARSGIQWVGWLLVGIYLATSTAFVTLAHRYFYPTGG